MNMRRPSGRGSGDAIYHDIGFAFAACLTRVSVSLILKGAYKSFDLSAVSRPIQLTLEFIPCIESFPPQK